ncbi:MAG: c-type cytochrome domain-containing protein [Verrucomicrobiales bacterium]
MHPQSQIARRLLCLLAASALAACGTTKSTDPDPGPDQDPAGPGASLVSGEEAFTTTVKPLFESRCVWCHRDGKALAGLNLQDREASLDSALRFIVPGHPDQSRIYRAVTLEAAHPNTMPGDGWGITQSQKDALHAWIITGAPWPEGPEGEIKKKSYRVDFDDYR